MKMWILLRILTPSQSIKPSWGPTASTGRMPVKLAWLPTPEKRGLGGVAVGEVKVSECGGEEACCHWALRWCHKEGAGRKRGNRAEGAQGNYALLSTSSVQPASLFTCIILFNALIFTVNFPPLEMGNSRPERKHDLFKVTQLERDRARI